MSMYNTLIVLIAKHEDTHWHTTVHSMMASVHDKMFDYLREYLGHKFSLNRECP